MFEEPRWNKHFSPHMLFIVRHVLPRLTWLSSYLPLCTDQIHPQMTQLQPNIPDSPPTNIPIPLSPAWTAHFPSIPRITKSTYSPMASYQYPSCFQIHHHRPHSRTPFTRPPHPHTEAHTCLASTTHLPICRTLLVDGIDDVCL